MSDDLFGQLAATLGELLYPLQRASESPIALKAMLGDLGVVPDVDTTAIVTAVSAVVDIKNQIQALAAEDSPSLTDIVNLLGSSARAFAALRKLDDSTSPVAMLSGIGRDLAERLVSTWLTVKHPVVHQIATLLTLIEIEVDQEFTPTQMQGTQVVRYPYRIERFHLNRLASLLSDPVGVLRAAYVTPLVTGADADAMADALFPKLEALFRELGISCRYGVNEGDEALLGDSAPLMSHAFIVYLNDPLRDLASEAGVVLSISSADRGDLGLVISPFGTLKTTRYVGPFTIELDLTAGIDVFAVGRNGFTLLANAGTTEVSGSATATLPQPPSGPAFVLGSPTGTRLEVGGAQLKAQTSLSDARQSYGLSADVKKTALVIAAGDGDSFVSELIPKDGLRAEFDLGIGWSSDAGLTLRGSAGMEVSIPTSVSFAGSTLSAVHVGLQATNGAVTAEVSGSFSASIGPVRAVLDRVGITGALTFPENGGNLGVADLALGFKGPSGVGLSVDAKGVLSGGGFLFHDEAQQLYAGAMQLSLQEQITLKAFGLIATRMPDGSRGYSMLIFITAEDFRPIPLGMGFMLLSIGGMVGVNRTFDEDVLRQGLKSGTLATLLFPRDPVGNATTLIQTLASAFPARRGSYLLGLLAKIGWLTPPLIIMDLALILEFGARERLLALGRISAQLPSADNDLVRLNMEAMGVIDFDAGTAAIDAVLVDSRLAHKFPITGSAALRAGFGSGPGSSFVLSVGGLNPHFVPPAGLPKLERVAIALTSGDNPRLICEAYFAITSNTVQFGARASLYASAIGFSVEGDIGFDVLVQLVPLHFIAEYDCRVQLKRGSHNLFSVELAGQLEGPRPLRVSGKATFKILFFHFSVHFDATLVHGDPPPLPASIDVLAQLTQALAAPSSWSTQRTAEQSHGVALRSLPAGSSTLVLDPLGQLAVKQQVVPLNTSRDIDLFGNAPVAGDRRFALTASLGDIALESSSLQASFAPAQYFEMSDDEKIAAPSFESMDAGCLFGSAATKTDTAKIVSAVLDYDTLFISPPSANSLGAPHAMKAASTTTISVSISAPPPYVLSFEQLKSFSRSGAAARVAVRRVGRARFRNNSVKQGAVLQPKRWTIMPKGDGAAATVSASVRTWSEYHAAVKRMNRGGARWQLLPTHEIES